MIYPLLRNFFFALDAETAHGLGMAGVDFLKAAGATCLLASAVLVALAAPGLAFAQTAKEVELEARVAQLEAQIQALLQARNGPVDGCFNPRGCPVLGGLYSGAD